MGNNFWNLRSDFLTFQKATFQHFTSTIGAGLVTQKKKEKHSSSNAEVMYRRQRMALAQARKPYLTVLLFTYDGRVISAQFLWRSASRLKVDRHISDIAFCATPGRRVNRKVFMLYQIVFHIGMKNYPIYCIYTVFLFVLLTLLNSAFLRHMYT